VSDLRDAFAPEVVEAIERLVDERVAAALTEREHVEPSPWLTIEESAEYLRVSTRLLFRLLSTNELDSVTLGRRRLLHRDDLDALARTADAATREGDKREPAPARRRSSDPRAAQG
jgi:excisionase family DNA binding protein